MKAYCESCRKVVEVKQVDVSFDFGASHQGPAGTQKDVFWGCAVCETEIDKEKLTGLDDLNEGDYPELEECEL